MSISMGINGSQQSHTVYWHDQSEPTVLKELDKIANALTSLP